jgi:hypothetical protein
MMFYDLPYQMDITYESLEKKGKKRKLDQMLSGY